MEPFTVWRIKLVSCDGARIGKTWKEWFFLSEPVALEYLKNKIEEENKNELRRNRNFALYQKDFVETICGWCNWQYGTMYILDSFEVKSHV